MKLLYSLLTLSALSSAAHAAPDLNVNDTTDGRDRIPGDGQCLDFNNKCSLRAAVEEANASGLNPIINLPNGEYRLTLGHISIESSLTIKGQSRERSVINGADASRVFYVVGDRKPVVALMNIGIINGRVRESVGLIGGAGLLVGKGAIVSLSSCSLLRNKAFPGAAINNNGANISINNCEFNSNETPMDGGGGQMYSGGALHMSSASKTSIVNSTFSYNRATRGGAIRNGGGQLDIIGSVFAFNQAARRGGALFLAGTTRVSFSTIHRNEVNLPIASTFGDESAHGGGIYLSNGAGSTLLLGNSIVAHNSDRRDPRFESRDYSPDAWSGSLSPIISYRGNILGVHNSNSVIKDFSSASLEGIYKGSNERPLVNVVVASVQSEIFEDSPAINASVSDTHAFFKCPSKDIRNFVRPAAGRCDSGAFEYGSTPSLHSVGTLPADIRRAAVRGS